MTDNQESKSSDANQSNPDHPDAALYRAMAKRLSGNEKMMRDIEVVEQASKYFGGLNRQERDLLDVSHPRAMARAGVAAEAVGATERFGESDAVTDESGTILNGSSAGVWLRAILSLLAFAGICGWVVLGK